MHDTRCTLSPLGSLGVTNVRGSGRRRRRQEAGGTAYKIRPKTPVALHQQGVAPRRALVVAAGEQGDCSPLSPPASDLAGLAWRWRVDVVSCGPSLLWGWSLPLARPVVERISHIQIDHPTCMSAWHPWQARARSRCDTCTRGGTPPAGGGQAGGLLGMDGCARFPRHSLCLSSIQDPRLKRS